MANTTGRARDNLRLRKAPNVKEEHIDIVRVNQQVQIIRHEGEWMYIRVDGNEGYVPSKFVVVEEP